MPFTYSADEGVDIGTDNETPVTYDYKEGANKFTGKIVKVTIQSGEVKLTDAEEKEIAKGMEAAAKAQEYRLSTANIHSMTEDMRYE